MLSDDQIDTASVFLAELLMEAVYKQAKKQSRKMIVDFSKREDLLPNEAILVIDYQIAIPNAVVREAIKKADG